MFKQLMIRGILGCVLVLFSLSTTWTTALQIEANPPFSVKWSPNGLMIASGGDGFLDIWDATTDMIMLSYNNLGDQSIDDVSWSPDSTKLAFTSTDQYVRIWNITGSGQPPGTVLFESQPFIERGLIQSVAWSPDDTLIAVGGAFGPPHLEIIDAVTYDTIGRHSYDWLDSLDWHPVAATRLLAAGIDDGGPTVFSALAPRDGSAVTIGDYVVPSREVEWNSDGSRIAVAYDDGMIYIWDTTTPPYSPSTVISTGTPGRFNDLAWGPDDEYIATVRGNIRFWDSTSGTLINEMQVPTVAIDFSPTGELAYAGVTETIDTIEFPTANAGPDQTLTDSDSSGSELVTLDGSGSSDPDGTITDYVWTEGGNQIATGVNPQVDLSVGVHTITLTVTDDDGATDTDEVVITVNAGGGTTTTTFQISASADDVNEDGATYDEALGLIWLGNGVDPASYLGLRFNNVTIPQGASITSAYLQFYSHENLWINVDLSIKAEASDNSVPFSSASRPSQRTLTTAQVNHSSSEPWTIDTWYDFNQMDTVIHEVVNRPGWQSGNSLSVILQGTGSQFGRKIVKAYDNLTDPALAPKLVVTHTQASQNTVNAQVATSTDDVNEDGATYDETINTVWLGNGENPTSYLGLRFANINVPQGATITTAYLQFYSAQDIWINVDLSIQAEASDNSATFTSASRPSQRTLTTTQVAHSSSEPWTINTWQDFDEMAAVIQEVINRPGWQSGNSLSVILQGTGSQYGRKFVMAYDNLTDPALAPKLVIKYSTP